MLGGVEQHLIEREGDIPALLDQPVGARHVLGDAEIDGFEQMQRAFHQFRVGISLTVERIIGIDERGQAGKHSDHAIIGLPIDAWRIGSDKLGEPIMLG